MNTKSSNWTGRAHRSLESAFGPHTSRHIETEDYPPMPPADVIVVATCAIGALALLAMLALGWLA